MSFQGFYISFYRKLFLLLKIFLKNFNQGQYGLIHIVHLVNFDQSLSTLHIVRSMLNFAMLLANSNQETIQFDSYCPHKVFITFHQRLMLFSISNAFKKLNQRQQNLIHIVLNITIVFRSALHFPIFPTNWSKDNTFDPCYILRVLSKNIFCLFQTFIKWESRTKRFDAHFSFKTLNKFLTNPLIFLCFKYF